MQNRLPVTLETLEQRVYLDGTYFDLSTGDFSQDWSNGALITTANDWSNVPSIIGYRGDGMTNNTSTDPQTTLLGDGSPPVVNVIQNSTVSSATGGIHEIDGVAIALQGSGTADSPYIQIHLNTTGRQDVTIAYTLTQLDSNDANQLIALQYRIGTTGNFVNVPAGAQGGFNAAGVQSFTKNVVLPAAVNDQATLQLRIMTNDAVGSDAMIGVDDIVVSSSAVGGGNAAPVNTVPGAQTVNEDTALTFTGGNTISVADADGNLATTKLTVSNGTVTVSLAGGATISSGQNSTATLTLSGTETQINAALATLSYQGTSNFHGSDTLTVLSTDSAGSPLTDSDTVGITVTSVNDAPSGTDGAVNGSPNADIVFTAADFGFTDPIDSPANTLLAVTITTLPAAGSLKLDGVAVTEGQSIPVASINSGLLTFTPVTDATGTPYTTFTFQVQDDGGTANTGVDLDPSANTLTININNVNDPPTIDPQTFTLAENTANGTTVGTVVASDPDAGDTKTFTITGGNSLGAFAISAAGVLTVADATQLDFETNPTFALTVTVTDTAGLSASNTITVNLTNVNEPPVVFVNRTISLNPSQTIQIGSALLKYLDPENSTLTYTVTSAPAAGSLTKNSAVITSFTSTDLNASSSLGNAIRYTTTGAAGSSDSFTVSVSDGTNTVAGIVVNIDIVSPTAAVSFTGPAYSQNFDNLLPTPIPTDKLTLPSAMILPIGWSVVEYGGTFGTVGGNAESSIQVDNGSSGTGDSMLYGSTGSNERALGSYASGSMQTVFGVALINNSGLTIDNFTLAYVGEQWKDGGSASAVINKMTFDYSTTASALGTGTYTAVSALDFTALVNNNTADAAKDGNLGANQTAISGSVTSGFSWAPGATLWLRWTDLNETGNDDGLAIDNLVFSSTINHAPVANDGNLTTDEDTDGTGTLVVTDAENTPAQLTISIVDSPAHGSVHIDDVHTGAYTYTPDGNYNGPDSFTFKANDGTADSNVATISITVNPVNDTPTIAPQTFSLAENSANGVTVGTVLASDVDVGDTQAFAITGGNSLGAFAIDSSGVITVADATKLDLETNPTFSLTVKVTDGGNLFASNTVTINLTNINEAPTIAPQTLSIEEQSANGTTVGTVVASDVDAGDSQVFTITGGNSLGAFAISSAGVITVADSTQLDFATNPTFSLTVTVTDAGSLFASNTITINVTKLNHPPTIDPQIFSLVENTANGATVGTVAASDVDAGDTQTFTITGGNSLGAFAISSAGVITVADTTRLDFESNPTFTLTVKVTDSGSLFASNTVTINLTDINEAPTIAPQAFSLAENTANGATVATVVANDADAGDTTTFTITGGNSLGAFAISSAGVITVADASKLDFETNPTFDLTVTVTDAASLFTSNTVTINLTDVNETPTISPQLFTLAENTANGTTVGTVVASDVDAGDTQTFTITGGNSLGAFAISAAGVITVADVTKLDFETNPTFTLTVTVTDGGSLFSSNTVTINLTDVNEVPTIAPQSFSLAENSSNGTTVGTVVASDVDAGDTQTFTITGGNSLGAFAISSAGVITVADTTKLDFETNPTFVLTVKVTDAGNLFASNTVTINLTDVNEAPTIVPQTFTIAENTANSVAVGTVVATDVDAGDTQTFTITGGNSLGAFAISSAGVITVADVTKLDFETNPTFTLTVTVTDSGSLFSSNTVTINLTDVNEVPTIAPQSFSLAENSANGTTVGTVVASDVDAGDTQTFTITGGNSLGAFAISSAGVITVADTTKLDFETNPTFVLTVKVTDAGNLFASNTVMINLTDVNEAPTIAPQTFTIAENTANSVTVGTVVANDVDAGDTQTFTITGGNSLGAFAISSAGVITVADTTKLDFETNPSFVLTVKVTDAGNLFASNMVTINLTNVNEVPVIAPQSFSIAENAANGTTVGTAVASDVDAGDTQTFTITGGNGLGAFAISSAGVITVADSTKLDFETNPTFVLTVKVTDAGNLFASNTVTINLTNVNEAPTIAPQTFTIAENSADNVTVGTVVANDVDAGDTQTFTITGGNSLGAFAISSAGVITVADTTRLNFETNPSFTLTVRVTDAGNLFASNTVTINLTNVNEAPTIAPQTFSVAENTANGVTVGTVVAADVDAGDTKTFSITGGNSLGAFAISSAGVITVADTTKLDFETNPSFTLTVQVTDAGNLFASNAVTINLTNVNEAPAIAPQTFSIPENSGNGVTVGTVVASDVDAGDTRAFSITGGNSLGAFAISSAGVITVADTTKLDFETNPSFTLTVRVTDAGNLFASNTVTINLTNVNEAPTIAPQTFTIAENTANSVTVGTVVANDVDAGDTQTFTITGGNSLGAFAISSAGVITVADTTKLDFETNPTFTLTVKVTDAGNLFASNTVTINLTNVNEAPTIAPQTFSLAENSANGATVGVVVAGDVDAGDSQTFSITSGNSLGAFAINSAGVITVADTTKLDFETNPSFTLTVKVSDAGNLFASNTVTINLTNVNEAPTIAPQTFSIAENTANGVTVGTVVAADVDAGDSRTFSITGGNSLGAFAISSGGVITVADTTKLNFETNPSFSLTVKVTDAGNLFATTTVTINLTNVNESPTIAPQTFSVAENTANGVTVGTVVASDADAGDTRTFLITGGNSLGAFAMSSSGVITVADTTRLDFETNTSFTLTISVTDAGSLSASNTVTINVTNVNEAPVAQGASLATQEDLSVGGTLAATDIDSQTLTYLIAGSPSHGSVLITNSTTGAYIYTPAPDYNGPDSFSFQASDGTNNSNIATISINIDPVNDAPTFMAGPNQVALEEAPAQTVANWAANVFAGQNESGQALNFVVTNDNNALFSVQPAISAAGTLTYALVPNANGTATVTVVLHDDGGTALGGVDVSVSKTFTITIQPVNDAPSFTAGANITVDEGSGTFTQAGWATGLSTGPANESAQVLNFQTAAVQPGLFSVAPSISANGTLTFTPAPFANGTTTVTVRIHDNGGQTAGGIDLSPPQTFTIHLNPVNNAPTDVILDHTTIVENVAVGTAIGQFTATDPDAGDTSTFTLVTGAGDTDNARFSITGNTLLTNGAIDFETHPTYSIRVQVQDGTGATFEKTLTLSVVDVNEPATLISLSSNTVAENQPALTQVGLLSSNDADSGDTQTFVLVSGTGSTDNGLFSISGNVLKTSASFNFEAAAIYSILVRVTDSVNHSYEQSLTIQVTNANEAPTNIGLSNASVAEGLPAGATVGLLSTTDPDQGNAFTYALVSGAGGDDNGLFRIVNNELQTNAVLDCESQPTYSIRVSSTDAGGLSTQKTLTITATNVNEAPVAIALSANDVSENRNVGTVVATLSTTDPDAGNTFTYTLVSGLGDDGNDSFAIVGNELRTNAVFDFETQPTYSIRVQSTDAGGLSVEQTFTISITNEADAPVVTLTPGSVTSSTGKVIPVDPGITLDAQDSTDFNGGQIQVSINDGFQSPDQLRLLTNGKGTNRLRAAGGNLKLGKVVIGTVTGGRSGTPLVINFTSSASVALVERVLKNVEFRTQKSHSGTRVLKFQVSDSAHRASQPVFKNVSIG